MSDRVMVFTRLGATLLLLICSFRPATAQKTLLVDPVPSHEIALCEIDFEFQTGGDDLRGGTNDNVYAAVNGEAWLGISPAPDGWAYFGGSLNGGRTWGGWQRTFKRIAVPRCAISLSRLNTIRLTTHFAGGVFGDNWDVRTVKVRAVGHFTDSARHRIDVCATLFSGSRYPRLFRFTGEVHDWDLTVGTTNLHSTEGRWGVAPAPCPPG